MISCSVSSVWYCGPDFREIVADQAAEILPEGQLVKFDQGNTVGCREFLGLGGEAVIRGDGDLIGTAAEMRDGAAALLAAPGRQFS
ncbi:MAG: hypothetical protein Q4F41_20385 [Eubacteriales bacterium]|nr:hypothetical protein [Eubacteriales bacterium]